MRRLVVVALAFGIGLAPTLGWAHGPRLIRWSLRGATRGYATPPYLGVPYAPYVAVPYEVRPAAPYVVDDDRNWRDTWQDDGVKVHGYTLR